MTQGLRAYRRLAAVLRRRTTTNVERLIPTSGSRKAEGRRFDERRLIRRLGMGTRCRSGRRPGGSDLAIIGQGSQAYLSLPAGCVAVSQSRQSIKAHVKAWDSVRTKAMEAAIGESRGNLHHT
jgi:hypothetical protein